MSHIHGKLNTIIVAISAVFHAMKYNRSRLGKEYGSLKQAAQSLARGWLRGVTMLARKATEDEKIAAVAALEVEHSNWEKAAKADGKDGEKASLMLKIWERLYLDQKGKIKVPDCIGIDGHRRHEAYLEAQYLRVTEPAEYGVWVDGNPAKGARSVGSLDNVYEDVDIEIVPEGTSEKDILLLQLQRNEKRVEGAKDITDADRLLAGQIMLDQNCIQADFRSAFKVTKGAKVYYVCCLDRRFPKLRLIERMTYAPPTKENPTPADAIVFKAVNFDKVQKLYQRLDVDTLKTLNANNPNSPKLKLLKQSECEAFFADVKKQAKAENEMTRDERKGLKANSTSEAIRIGAHAMLTKRTDLLEEYVYPCNKIINASLRMDAEQRAQVEALIDTMELPEDIPGYQALLDAEVAGEDAEDGEETDHDVETPTEADPDLDTEAEIKATKADEKPVKAPGRGRVAPAKAK